MTASAVPDVRQASSDAERRIDGRSPHASMSRDPDILSPVPMGSDCVTATPAVVEDIRSVFVPS
jgi:hypothetical protein